MNTAARSVIYAMIAVTFASLIAVVVFGWFDKKLPEPMPNVLTGAISFLTGVLAQTKADVKPKQEETP